MPKQVLHNELEKILEIAFKSKTSYFVWGTTGIGKSQTTYKLAKRLAKEKDKEFAEWNELNREEKLEVISNAQDYFLFVDERALQYDLGDFKLPNMNEDEGTFEWCIPLTYEVLCDDQTEGILFFDEFNLAPPNIMGEFYQIIEDRQIGGHSISDKIFIIGAGNRLEDKANVYEMPAPLLDRFEHIELRVPPVKSSSNEDWTTWGLKNDIDNRIITFLQFQPSFLFKFDKEKTKEDSFPTPRGWEKLSRMIEGIPTKNNYDLLESIIASNVGEGVASEMISYLKLTEKYEIDNFLKNPIKIERLQNEGEIDLLWSLVSQLPQVYNNDKEKVSGIFKIVKRLDEEFAVMTLRMMREAHPEHFRKVALNTKFIRKYYKFIVD